MHLPYLQYLLELDRTKHSYNYLGFSTARDSPRALGPLGLGSDLSRKRRPGYRVCPMKKK